ncbi:adenylate kinase [Bacillus halotolerans]|uniref:adenylate kinase n=2 Tax=Bacteria TaxID=2 RepID=UPI0005C6FE0C|nr:adenylate kinase [Bacillus halotolerans]QQF63583.1 adenylate kinase [Bacillus mojavensis]KUP37653.1 adenylate kinase [Bacillus halotolerans]MDG3075164.1 adenylate kinase [Bacillus halotolerans]MDQ7726786.1 ATP-binding protein [Bacillus halotolerans]MEC1407769.1 adenylate kinase [Bacillus halotolerans]
MLYLIGGSSRSGKTTTAKRMLAETKIPYFSLDYLMMGIANGVPEMEVNPTDGDLKNGQRLWKIMNPLMTAMVENKIDYVIEGVQLIPSHVSKFEQRYLGNVKTCFIGIAEIDIENSIDKMKFYSSMTENDGLRNLDHLQIKSELKRIKTDSIRIKEECQKYNLQYFESSLNFNKTIESIISYLI